MASTSRKPKETPSSSTFQTPQPPAGAPDEASDGSTGGRGRGRPKGSKDSRPRRTTTKKKTTVARSEPKPRQVSKPVDSDVKIDPQHIELALEGVGDVLHPVGAFVCRVDPDHEEDLFRFTAQERKELAPPIARVLQRHVRVAAPIIAKSDELVIASILAKYVGRNAVDVRALRALYEQEEGDDDAEPGQAGDVPRDGHKG